MVTKMPLTTLKEKGQITLPNTIRKQINATKGDLFDCEVIDGKVVMTQQRLVPANEKKAQSGSKGVDISKYIGFGKGIFGSVEEIDDYIRKERETWD